METSRRNSRVSEAQWIILLDFLERNPNLARGYNNTARGLAESSQRWKEVADLLNAEGSGSLKSPKDWFVHVSNYKSKLKKIVADINADSTATGGGPPGAGHLSDQDNRFLALLGPGFGQMPARSVQRPSSSDMPQTLGVAAEVDVQHEDIEDVVMEQAINEAIASLAPAAPLDAQARPSVLARSAVPSTPGGSAAGPSALGGSAAGPSAPGGSSAGPSALGGSAADRSATAGSDAGRSAPAGSAAGPFAPAGSAARSLPRQTRQTRYRSRPLAPLDQARRILSQVKMQRAAATAQAMDTIAQNIGRVAEAHNLISQNIGRIADAAERYLNRN